MRFPQLDAYLAFYGGIGVVAFEVEVFVFEIEDVLHFGIDYHFGKGAGFASELEIDLIEMIEIDMGISKSVYELARLQAAYLRKHHSEKGV